MYMNIRCDLDYNIRTKILTTRVRLDQKRKARKIVLEIPVSRIGVFKTENYQNVKKRKANKGKSGIWGTFLFETTANSESKSD